MIDWDRIAELQMEVGEDGLADLLEIFFDEFQETLDAMTPTPDTLHFLKGMASNIGMSVVSSLCQAGEGALKDDPASKVDLDKIRIAYDEAKTELTSAFQ